jgi:membrane dipeptidase
MPGEIMIKRSVGFIVVLVLVLAVCTGSQAPPTVEQRARDLHARILTVDTHCDTPMRLLRADWNIGERHDPAERASGKIDLPRMKEGGLDAEFFAAFVGQGPLTPEGYERAKTSALRAVEAVVKMTQDHASMIGLAVDPAGARRLKKEGKLVAFIGMENGYPLGRDLTNVKFFHDQGVRYITLCHSSDNDICDSSTDRRDPEDKGLSAFGREVVAECNRLGMIVDISHASDKSFYDVIAASRAPIIASHSSARAVCDNPRNLTDDQLRALAKKDGVVQICFLGAYVKAMPPRPRGRRPSRSSRPSTATSAGSPTRRSAARPWPPGRRSTRSIPRPVPTSGTSSTTSITSAASSASTTSVSAPISMEAVGSSAATT